MFIFSIRCSTRQNAADWKHTVFGLTVSFNIMIRFILWNFFAEKVEKENRNVSMSESKLSYFEQNVRKTRYK